MKEYLHEKNDFLFQRKREADEQERKIREAEEEKQKQAVI